MAPNELLANRVNHISKLKRALLGSRWREDLARQFGRQALALWECDVTSCDPAIEDDLVPGPRLAASGREICGAGGLMDWNPDFRKIGMEGLMLLIDGPDEARRAVRKLVKDGVEWVKTYPTGDAAGPDVNDHHTLCMTFDEMHAVGYGGLGNVAAQARR